MLELDAYREPLGDEETKKIATAFRETFDTEAGRLVLETLEGFCAVYATTMQATDRETFAMEGRRQAFLFIQDWVTLDWREFD